MKLQITNVITGGHRVVRASLSTTHSSCSYGQPVLLVEGEPWGTMECVLGNPRVVEPPKSKTQLALLAQWQRNLDLDLYLGVAK